MKPKFKRLPKCIYRIDSISFWSKLFLDPECRNICGNTTKVSYCSFRDKVEGWQRCNFIECGMEDYGCACCYFCKKSKKERLGMK